MELVNLIAEKKGISKDDVRRHIEKKRRELDYLISEEGAAHIIASEYGIDASHQFKVTTLTDGASGIDIFLKVLSVSPAREFERKGKKGKVRNILAMDETGEVGVSLWDDKADLELTGGEIIKMSGAYVRKTGMGMEIRAGRRSSLDIDPEHIPEELKKVNEKENQHLGDAEDGEETEVRAEITNVTHREPFFNSDVGRQLMISGTIDDGSTIMRAIFFRNAAEVLLRLKTREAIKLADEEGFESLLNRVPVMRELKLQGRIKHNDYTDSKELIVNRVRRVNPGEKVDRMLEKIMGVI